VWLERCVLRTARVHRQTKPHHSSMNNLTCSCKSRRTPVRAPTTRLRRIITTAAARDKVSNSMPVEPQIRTTQVRTPGSGRGQQKPIGRETNTVLRTDLTESRRLTRAVYASRNWPMGLRPLRWTDSVDTDTRSARGLPEADAFRRSNRRPSTTHNPWRLIGRTRRQRVREAPGLSFSNGRPLGVTDD
jgi:hypothetical protein